MLALLLQASVEQIAAPQSPAAAVRVEQPTPAPTAPTTRGAIAQLPPVPLAVEQPRPRPSPRDGGDAAADAARTYAAILGGGGVASPAGADLTGRTIADAAAAASLAPAPPSAPRAGTAPVVAPRRP